MKQFTTIILILLGVINLQAQTNTKNVDALIQQTFEAMGGMDNWNHTHFIQWDFGKRTLYWDKWTGNVRVENPDKNITLIVNINTGEGKALQEGKLITDAKTLNKVLEQGKKWWINDSYWLTMPWKLKDTGVKLQYLKSEALANGNKADVLEMTFNGVGVTPQNKYHIYIDQKDHLVKQWAFFGKYTDDKPRFVKAWDNYQKVNDILLSFNRTGKAGGPKNVIVKDIIPSEIFSKL